MNIQEKIEILKSLLAEEEFTNTYAAIRHLANTVMIDSSCFDKLLYELTDRIIAYNEVFVKSNVKREEVFEFLKNLDQ